MSCSMKDAMNTSGPFGMRMAKTVMEEIRRSLGRLPAECGGILGADETGLITHYYFDKTGAGTANSYEPDVETVNAVLLHQWLPQGVKMVGIVHSHAGGLTAPSCGDVHYGMRILQALENTQQFYLPIVTGQESEMKLNAYAVEKDAQLGYVCRRVALETV